MFSFFKRKKSVTENVSESQEPKALSLSASLEEVAALRGDSDVQPLVVEPQLMPNTSPEDHLKTEPTPQLPEVVPIKKESSSIKEEAAEKKTWFSRLKAGLAKTRNNLAVLFTGVKIDEALYEELEAALLMSDAGIEATEFLLEALRLRVKRDKLTDSLQVKEVLRELLVELLTPLMKPLNLNSSVPLVVMMVGVNGAGKTTTIGKLAKHFQAQQKTVLLAAGDTFRAAAREQLVVWGERNGVTVIAQDGGDPAAVAFDAVQAGCARNMGVVMIDTAGRLPTQLHLMEELKKIKRVVTKAGAQSALALEAPHEVLLVVDANTGQNALQQVKVFDDALGLTGLIVTKLDGSAKGGVLAAIARTRPVPVYYVGVGESLDDLQRFVAQEFVDALLN
jgi:fused signal recognition particle receptor